MRAVRVLPWNAPEPPEKNAIRKLLDGEGLTYYAWGNAPLETYAAHTHPYHKVIYVTQGSITFHLPHTGQSLTLRPGAGWNCPLARCTAQRSGSRAWNAWKRTFERSAPSQAQGDGKRW